MALARAELHRRYKKDPQYLPKLFLERYLFHANNTLGIFSLSRRWNSTLMWSHYSLSHSGFCIGFNSEHPFFKRQPRDPNDIGQVEPVEYHSDRLTVPIDRAFQLNARLFYRKSLDWRYEEEERLCRMLRHSDSTIKRLPLDIHLFKVPHAAIVEIIYGVAADPPLKQKICNTCRALGVHAWEALISSTCFDVERKQVV